jgi:hypothetical protein
MKAQEIFYGEGNVYGTYLLNKTKDNYIFISKDKKDATIGKMYTLFPCKENSIRPATKEERKQYFDIMKQMNKQKTGFIYL